MNVYVWGTGGLLKDRLDDGTLQLEKITAFIDNDNSKTEWLGKKVFSPEQIIKMDYDAIVITSIHYEEIYAQCCELGIDLRKVIFFQGVIEVLIQNKLHRKKYELSKKIIENKGFNDLDFEYTRNYITHCKNLNTKMFDDKYWIETEIDYVRISSLELAVKEIRNKNIQGEIAEFGVCRGDFAKYINYAFPEKKLYLFDTFEGFDEDEANDAIKKGYVDREWCNSFADTNIELVMSKMKYPDNIVIKQGFFPQSLNGLEEKFCFVSIDCDFEESMLEGLRYFYPRLSIGGYLFLHDYNSYLPGVRKAVERYEKEINISLCKVPLCDNCGTIVITK